MICAWVFFFIFRICTSSITNNKFNVPWIISFDFKAGYYFFTPYIIYKSQTTAVTFFSSFSEQRIHKACFFSPSWTDYVWITFCRVSIRIYFWLVYIGPFHMVLLDIKLDVKFLTTSATYRLYLIELDINQMIWPKIYIHEGM